MTEQLPTSDRKWLPPVLLATIGLAMTVWTWGTWLHEFIDFGRELYVPWRITEGDVLYRDIAYFNGPLSAYWNALLFQLFGVGLRTLVLANLVILGGTCWLLYRLLFALSDRLTATLACAVYLFLFGFGQIDRVANFNWVCPYSHEMTHGIALAIVAISLFVRWMESLSPARLAYVGLVTGLVFLTKVEVFVACGLAIGTGLMTIWWRRPDYRARAARDAGLLAATTATPALVATLLLATAMPFGDAVTGTIGGWAHVTNTELTTSLYYRACLGFDAPGQRLRVMGYWALIWLAVLLPGFLVAVLLRRKSSYRLWIAIAVAAATLLLHGEKTNWKLAFLPLTPALIVIGALCLRPARPRFTLAAILVAFAAGLLLKMPLHARLYHYGFGLALPVTMLCIVAWFHWVPSWLDRKGLWGNGQRIAGLGIALLVVVGHGMHFGKWVARHTETIGKGADRFSMLPEWHRIFESAIAGFDKIPADATVAVVPEGVMLNYLARRRTSVGHINFMPPEIAMFGQPEILAAFRENPPTYIILMSRVTIEYGPQLFAIYGKKIFDWIVANYVVIPNARFGPDPMDRDRVKDFAPSLWILKRNG